MGSFGVAIFYKGNFSESCIEEDILISKTEASPRPSPPQTVFSSMGNHI